MKHLRKCAAIAAVICLILVPAAAQESKTFRIPRIAGLNVDGSGADWGEDGFRVDLVLSPDGKILPAEDFDVRFRLAWNEKGLYNLAVVRDDIPLEHENESRLWRRDSVEFFVGSKESRHERYQLVVVSGADPKFGKIRSRLYDHRSGSLKTIPLEFETASLAEKKQAVIEAFFPWAALGIEARIGAECAFQFIANDDDNDGNGLRVAWFPSYESVGDPGKMYTLTLSDAADDPVDIHCDRRIKKGEYEIDITGTASLSGKTAVVRFGKNRVEKIDFALKGGRSCASFYFSLPANLSSWPRVSVEAGDKHAADFEEMPFLEDVYESYLRALGGREPLAKMTARQVRGVYRYDLSALAKEVPLHGAGALPDKWSVMIQGEGWVEKNGYDGKAGWKQNKDRIQEVKNMGRSILGWWLNPRGPLKLETYYPDPILKEKINRENRSYFVVETASGPRPKHRLEFDAQTRLLDRIDGRWEFKDYRSIDGTLFPYRLVIDGEREFLLAGLSHNPDVDKKIFTRPSTAEEFADAFEGLEESKILPLLKVDGLVSGHEEMNVPCRDGRFLYDLILEKHYKRGLEIGTFTGYSTLWMGAALQKTGGKIFTIEIDPSYARIARENFKRAELENVIDSRINDAFEEISVIEGTFDIIFLDAEKRDYLAFFNLLKDRINSGGAFVAHNVTNYARDMRDFLSAVQNDPGFETSFHEMSAEGFSMSIKRK